MAWVALVVTHKASLVVLLLKMVLVLSLVPQVVVVCAVAVVLALMTVQTQATLLLTLLPKTAVQVISVGMLQVLVLYKTTVKTIVLMLMPQVVTLMAT
jgi:hypothetical protein